MDSQLDILTSIYSASIDLSATKVFFVLNHDITVDPKMKQHHEVLFLSSALPAQYESKYPCRFTPSPPRYLNPYSTLPLKYLSTCFAAIQCTCLSSTMNWLKVFKEKHISGLVLIK
jgi:hypothetical protein